ncbi:hypothetical protein K439DRAFT_549809 [Ramaria rubella]|nr:hypothetical protein K439DRAFT_549809 [Ramaria rubella]
MLSTPRGEKRSSSYPYVVPTGLAPAPIISPANSSHSSIYHASPQFLYEELEPGLKHDFSRAMEDLVSRHNDQATTGHAQDYDLTDPFIVHKDEFHSGTPLRKRYPSPQPLKHHQHCSTHSRTSPLGRGPLEDSIARLVMSPSEFSEAHVSPVKVEVDNDVNRVPPRSLIIDKATPRTPGSPRTPPRAGSTSCTPALEDSASRTPSPAFGGEIDRIRQRRTALQETRTAESEKHRPEYLTRIKRARDNADHEGARREREDAIPGLGVTISPSRGRRLKLYQPVAVPHDAVLNASVEMGETEEPQTPPPLDSVAAGLAPSWQPLVPAMSLRAIDWRTPGRGRSPLLIWTKQDQLKKQRRLEAFAAREASGKGKHLKPAEVVGQGRVVIDVTSRESRELAEAGVLQFPSVSDMDTVESKELPMQNGHGAEWPDKEYPWSVKEQERDDLEEAERRQRLVWIERFLDRESESEDEDSECVAGPSNWNLLPDAASPTRPQRSHTKSVSLISDAKRAGNGRHMSFGAVTADAREVLLSKKYVRAVAERALKRKAAEEEEGVVMCICQGADDGRPMVRCDECRTWYHLVCMDIHDESELGDEWYCWKCLPSGEDPPLPPSSEPTFAPAMPESPPRAGVGDQPFYLSALQPSPMPASPVANRKRDRSPRRSRLPHTLGDPGDPVRGGPSTPYQPQSTESRLYSTPKFYDEYAMDDHAPFDPTSTPSRGLKFPNPVPITPRRSHAWASVQPLLWTTPSGPSRTPVQGPSSSHSLAYSLSTLEDSVGPLTSSPWHTDESPTRRPHKRGDSSWPYPTSRRLFDSPLGVRSGVSRSYLKGVEESPTTQQFRGRDGDLGELSSRSDRGKSPPHHD